MPIRESDFRAPLSDLDAGSVSDDLAPILNDIRQMIESSGRGLVCTIQVRGESVSIPDATNGELTYPLLSAQGDSLGWITLSYPEGQGEAAGDRELLRSASHLASSAIEQRLPVRRDTLTGLLTRGYFARRAAYSSPYALLAIELDRVQPINDSFGREMGDQVLQQASERVKALLGESDFAGRLDGVEFAVALVDVPGGEGTLSKAEKFLEALRAPYHIQGIELFVTASIGVAIQSEAGNADHLMREANLAMHVAKRGGGNGLEVFRPESHTRSVERLRLENALRRSMENEELDLVFQPIVDLRQKLQRFEVLLTWRHPEFGLVPASVFIPIAEANGFINELGAWVMRQACRQGARWLEAGRASTRLSVNVSARQFEQDGFGKTLAETLAATGFPAKFLELELTESCIVRDLPRSAERMSAIRGLGLSIAIDDFGTGYSSLSYLSKLPVDTLKLDQSFIRDITEGASLAVIQGIVRLAHNMNLTVVAEGVETAEQLDLVRLVGCDSAQGNYCGPALPAEEAEKLLAREFRASQ